MSTSTSERREYFRINDQALISISPNTEDQQLESLLKQHASFTIRSAMNALELEHQAISSKIKRSSPEIFHYFDVINKKIDLITNHLVQASSELSRQIPTTIDLSASGVALTTQDSYSVGDQVCIQLLLLPENNGIICLGIIKQLKAVDKGYHIAIDFTNINEDDRELIIKHTMKKQLEDARNKNPDY
ncbi:MAG: PilZ domain-containing protein [Gammaproteobacteria bacterium]|nr:PilZ domain-containing protein [Gammaproteobacteria bacterium]